MKHSYDLIVPYGFLSASDPVCQGSPPKFTQKPRSLTVDEGSSLKLTCKVEGDPEPAISWSKDGRIISPGQRIVLKKLGLHLRILQIPTALSTDAGSYTCLIANANGEEKCTVSVVVHPLDEEQTDFRQLLKSRYSIQFNSKNKSMLVKKENKKQIFKNWSRKMNNEQEIKIIYFNGYGANQYGGVHRKA